MSQRPNALPWRHSDAGVIVYFRLTPKSSKDAVEGLQATAEGPAFQARVRAVPEDGAANAALELLVAEWLDVPKRTVSLTAGGKSRLKSLQVTGNPAALESMLQVKLGNIRDQKR